MAGIKKIVRLIENVGQTIQTRQVTTQNGIILHTVAKWKGRTLFPGAQNYIETALWFTFTDSSGGNPLGEGSTGSDVFVLPAFGVFQWFHPWGAPINESAEVISRLRTTGVVPLGLFRGGFSINVVHESWNPVATHDAEFELTYLELDN